MGLLIIKTKIQLKLAKAKKKKKVANWFTYWEEQECVLKVSISRFSSLLGLTLFSDFASSYLGFISSFLVPSAFFYMVGKTAPVAPGYITAQLPHFSLQT